MIMRTRMGIVVVLCVGLLSLAAPLTAGEPANGDMAGLEENSDAMGMAPAPVDVSPEYEAAIRTLMDHTGVGNIGEALKANILQGIQRAMPDVSTDKIETLAADINADIVTDHMVTTFARHLTFEEVQEINAFLETPAGQKYLTTQPVIIREGIQYAETWARGVYTQIVGQLQSQQMGTEDDTMIMPDATAPAGE